MDRHFVVITYLEWLNWCARGVLRVLPARIMWVSPGMESEAFANSMQMAPDLEPADDGFLIATVGRAPQPARGAAGVVVSLEHVQFEALSERSLRLFAPSAARMHADLALCSQELQEAWSQWKQAHLQRAAELRAVRVWSWARDMIWPAGVRTDSAESSLMQEISAVEAQILKFARDRPEVIEKVSGTTARPWYEMTAVAINQGLLDKGEGASWKEPTNQFVAACRQKGGVDARLLAADDALLVRALVALPLEDAGMSLLLACAVGKHHAYQVALGQDFNFEAFQDDLGEYSGLYRQEAQAAVRRRGVDAALLALGRALPDAAVAALVNTTVLRRGWASALLGNVQNTSVPQRADIDAEHEERPNAERVTTKVPELAERGQSAKFPIQTTSGADRGQESLLAAGAREQCTSQEPQSPVGSNPAMGAAETGPAGPRIIRPSRQAVRVMEEPRASKEPDLRNDLEALENGRDDQDVAVARESAHAARDDAIADMPKSEARRSRPRSTRSKV